MRYRYVMMAAAALCAGAVNAADTLEPAMAAGKMPEMKMPDMCILKLTSGKEVPGPCEMDGARKVRTASQEDLNKFMPPLPPAPPAGMAPAMDAAPMGMMPSATLPVGLPAGIPPARPVEITPAK